MDRDGAVGVVTGAQLQALREVALRLDGQGLSAESGAILDVVDAVARGRLGVSTGDAAQVLGVSPQTIRNWVRGGVLAGWSDATGHILVAPEALESAQAMRNALLEGSRPNLFDAEIDAEIAAVRAEQRKRGATAG